METKKNIGVLSMNEKYTLECITDVGEDFCACDNCGKIIRFVAQIKNSKNKTFNVGTECAKTLSFANFLDVYRMEEEIKELKKIAEIKKVLQRPETLVYMYAKEDGTKIAGDIAGKATEKAKAKRYDIPDSLREKIEKMEYKVRYAVGGYCLNNVFSYLDFLNGKRIHGYRYFDEDGELIDKRG